MWTPKRIMLLAVGFLLFSLVYMVYSATSLGRINTLPPLPEHYQEYSKKDVGDGPLRIKNGPSPLERKMERAFGLGCKELKWPVQLDLYAKSMVMAAGMFEIEPDGRMKLEPMSIALFGKKKNDGRDVEINTLKCSQAYLTFDRPVANINEISGRKIVQAELIGDIVIVNNRRTALRDDDLSVTIATGPLYYFEPQQLIRTSDAVHLIDGQLKPPKADVRAKGMEMELATAAPPPRPGFVAAPKPKNESISGVKRIVLKQDVTMHFYTAGPTPFPNSDKSRAEPAAKDKGKSTQAVAKPPQETSHIVIRTPGRFQYDLFKDHDLARFDVPEEVGQPSAPQDVTVERINDATGTRDQLVCKHLELRLKRRDGEAQPASRPAAQTAEQGLEIQTAHATGPDVTLASDAEKLDAHGNDFFHDAAKKLTILKGVPYMEANKEDSVMQAPEMQIQDIPVPAAPGGPPKTYQQVTAKGPGRIDLPKKAGDKVVHTTHATWNEKLTSTRDGALDLLILTGSASFVDDEQEQSLKAETLKVWLLTQESKPAPDNGKQPTAKTPEAKPAGDSSRRPYKVEALRNVLAHSRDLNIHDAGRLIVRFVDVPKERMPPPSSNNKPGARPPENKPSAVPPTAPILGPAPPAPGKPPATPIPAPTTAPAKPAPDPARPIDLTARSVEADVLRCGERNALDHLWTEGYVKVSQAPARPGEKGVYIEGDTLDMRAQEGGNHLVVTGRDDQGNMALLQMDKMLIFGPEVNIDQAGNKAWVVGSGAMQMDSNTSLDGRPLLDEKASRPGKPVYRTVPLTVHWSEEMFFQGANAEFTGNIQAEQENARLACQSLQVYFDRPISLKEGTRGDQPAKVRNLVGFKDVRVEDKALDGNKLQKYQLLEGRSITMDTVPRDDGPRTQGAGKDANDVTLSGPGSVRLMQRGGSDLPALPGKPAPAKPAALPPARAPGEPEMTTTYVKFETIMKASNRTNTANFWGSVRVLHFPCDDPHYEIDLDAMLATELPPGAMYLRCDRLKVLSTPAAPGQKGNQEMEAYGHIVVQAKEFSAQCDKMTYNEAKDQIIFIAEPGNTATLAKYRGKGVQPDMLRGEKILYIRRTDKAEVIKGDSLFGN